MDFSKLLAHPDKEEIISKLVTGVKPKDVSDWLKLKYPDKDQSHLRLSSNLLKEFLDNSLDLYETLKQDISTVKDGDKQNRQISESLRNNKTYQERLSEIASNEVDIKRMMIEVGVLLRARVEQYFDKMQENPSNLKADYGLIKYFEILLNYAEKYDKIVNQAPDQIIQHNVTVQVMDQYVSMIQNCITSTLAEIDPDAASLFLEKFHENLGKLQLPDAHQPVQIPQEKRLAEAKILSTSLPPSDDGLDFPEVQ